MLVVIPVSQSDVKLIAQTEQAFEIFPPGSGHSLLVVGSPEVEEEVQQLAQSLAQHFAGHSNTFIFDGDNNQGWPTACNFYFQSVAFQIPNVLAPGESWLWYELDCTPVRENWLDEIAQAVETAKTDALRENRQPAFYFGVREKTHLELGGRLMPADEAGFQMAAVGVYPSEMSGLVVTLPTITATNQPWYTFIRWYVAYDFFHPLALIQNNWRTAAYERVADGTIKCQSRANWAWDIHFNKDIAPETVLVHGCKDGSLLELFAAEHELVKEEGIPVQDYWTDAGPEPPEKQEEVEAAPKRKRNINKDAVEAARKRLMEMHAKRRAAKLAELASA
jgi:hypothetical protein